MSAASPSALPLVLVAEDGAEYTERFTRLLGAQFEFVRIRCFSGLLSALESLRESAPARSPAALVLDLDFRRTPPEELVDADGQPALASQANELAPVQGILILRALRKRGEPLPALLCADLDDPAQARALCGELGPLQLSPSSESLPALAARLRVLAGLDPA